MILLETVSIREIRGIRELDLDLHSKPFVIYGPNGSGKSGVVDSIEFALTGNISRLHGEGTAGVTVRKHGPHVLKRDDPESAVVTLGLHLVDLGRSVTVTRSVRNPDELVVEPDGPEVREILEDVSAHPEVVLSRREVIKFVVAEAGERSREIQALLRLDGIGGLRSALKTAQNRTAAAAKATEDAVADATAELCRHFDTADFEPDVVLERCNRERQLLGLPVFDALDDETALNDGAVVGASGAQLNKATALRDLAALIERLARHDPVADSVSTIIGICKQLKAEAGLLELLRRRPFLEQGVDLIDSEECPLCDTGWESRDALESHLREKLSRSASAQQLLESLHEAAAAVGRESASLQTLIVNAREVARSESQEDLRGMLDSWSKDLSEFVPGLASADSALASEDRLESAWIAAPAGLEDLLRTLSERVRSSPDQSSTANAQTFLAVAQERFARSRRTLSEHERANKARAASAVAYRTYCDEAEVVLRRLYEEVEADFTDYYRWINSDDESTFKARFDPRKESSGWKSTLSDTECSHRLPITARGIKTEWVSACT